MRTGDVSKARLTDQDHELPAAENGYVLAGMNAGVGPSTLRRQ